MPFSVTSAHVCVVLIYFVHPFVGVGAHGWVVDIAGHGGSSIWQRLGCWPAIGLFWAPVLHLRRNYVINSNYLNKYLSFCFKHINLKKTT